MVDETVRRRFPRWIGIGVVFVIVAAMLYLPIRRELIDRGVIAAASLHSHKPDARLTLYGNGTYVDESRRGQYTIERFPDAPWISLIRLDDGQSLHVKYEDRVYQVEDISRLEGADIVFVRD
jgi:hypothetical protein